MARIQNKIKRGNIELIYLTHCDGQTRRDIAKQYNVNIKNVKKLDSYMAVITKK